MIQLRNTNDMQETQETSANNLQVKTVKLIPAYEL